MTRIAHLLHVPDEMIRHAWKDAERWLAAVPGLDLAAQRARLFKGEDRLWIPVLHGGSMPAKRVPGAGLGVVITRVTEKAPANLSKLFPLRSLTVHLAEGVAIECWIQSAVETLTRYAKDEGCRQLFVQARRGWRTYATKFYSTDWEKVGYSRDRPTAGQGSHYPGWNEVGKYRLMHPVKRMTKGDYNTGSMCFFEERHAAV